MAFHHPDSEDIWLAVDGVTDAIWSVPDECDGCRAVSLSPMVASRVAGRGTAGELRGGGLTGRDEE